MTSAGAEMRASSCLRLLEPLLEEGARPIPLEHRPVAAHDHRRATEPMPVREGLVRIEARGIAGRPRPDRRPGISGMKRGFAITGALDPDRDVPNARDPSRSKEERRSVGQKHIVTDILMRAHKI